MSGAWVECSEMRIAAIVVVFFVGFGARVGAAAQPALYADVLCPESVQRVQAMSKMKAADPPAAVYEAVRAAMDAYQVCLERQLGDGNIEPGVHYAQLREAQFGVLAGRALAALGRVEDARTELERDRKLAANVAEWQYSNSGSNIGVNKGTYGQYSVYRDTAKDVVAAADAELARLPPRPH
jgi:hypothetical protein